MDRYLSVNFDRPGIKLLDGLVPYMHYTGVPHAVLDGYVALTASFVDAKRDAFFVTPASVSKGDLDAWVRTSKERGSAGCLPPYRIILVTQTDYFLDDDEKQDGYEYLLCWYDPDWTKSSMGRFRTHDTWEDIRKHITKWAAALAREHKEKGYRVPGAAVKPPLWYPPCL